MRRRRATTRLVIVLWDKCAVAPSGGQTVVGEIGLSARHSAAAALRVRRARGDRDGTARKPGKDRAESPGGGQVRQKPPPGLDLRSQRRSCRRATLRSIEDEATREEPVTSGCQGVPRSNSTWTHRSGRAARRALRHRHRMRRCILRVSRIRYRPRRWRRSDPLDWPACAVRTPDRRPPWIA